MNQVVDGLTHEGMVSPVQLSLFAEMVKGRAWTPATLRTVGARAGSRGRVPRGDLRRPGVAPGASAAPARRGEVLRLLLRDQGPEIRGHMRPYRELLEASGYVSRPEEFGDLMRILDAELRLITPTDPEGVAGDEWRVAGENAGHRDPPPATHHPPPTATSSRTITSCRRCANGWPPSRRRVGGGGRSCGSPSGPCSGIIDAKHGSSHRSRNGWRSPCTPGRRVGASANAP